MESPSASNFVPAELEHAPEIFGSHLRFHALVRTGVRPFGQRNDSCPVYGGFQYRPGECHPIQRCGDSYPWIQQLYLVCIQLSCCKERRTYILLGSQSVHRSVEGLFSWLQHSYIWEAASGELERRPMEAIWGFLSSTGWQPDPERSVIRDQTSAEMLIEADRPYNQPLSRMWCSCMIVENKIRFILSWSLVVSW